MSVVVRIPTPLRRMTNGQDKVEVQSGSLGAMVEELEGAYPGLYDRQRKAPSPRPPAASPSQP